METYDLVDALQAHQGQRHSTSCCQASETCSIRRQPHYGIFYVVFRYRRITQRAQRLGDIDGNSRRLLQGRGRETEWVALWTSVAGNATGCMELPRRMMWCVNVHWVRYPTSLGRLRQQLMRD